MIHFSRVYLQACKGHHKIIGYVLDWTFKFLYLFHCCALRRNSNNDTPITKINIPTQSQSRTN